MRCVLTALGSYGDVFPMIGLGAAMQDRGHDVRLVASPYFAEVIRGAGLRFAGVGTADDYVRLTQNPDLWSPTSGLALVFREGALGVLEELYEIVERLLTPGDTVIAAHGLDLASRVLAETHSAPVASIVYAPMAIRSDIAPPRMPAGVAWPGAPRWLHRLQFALGDRLFGRRIVLPALQAFRAERGLPQLTGNYWRWYYGVAPPLCLFPDWFVEPNRTTPADWPTGTVLTGFPLGDAAHPTPEMSDELKRFLAEGDGPDTAPIAFTPGSAMRHGEAFFTAAVDACRRMGRRGVLLTKYPEQLPGRLPGEVLAPGFTPLEKLLPRCAAFVHHGGIGSCARGLAAGVPQLIQPMAFDQHDNAWRLQRLGVAEELSPRRFQGHAVAAKLGRLLESEPVRDAATHWAQRCDPTAALTAACEALEQRLGRL